MCIVIGDKVLLWSNFCLDHTTRQEYVVVNIEDDWYAGGDDPYLYRLKGMKDGEEVLVEGDDKLCLLDGDKRKLWAYSECWITFCTNIRFAQRSQLVAKLNRSWIIV